MAAAHQNKIGLAVRALPPAGNSPCAAKFLRDVCPDAELQARVHALFGEFKMMNVLRGIFSSSSHRIHSPFYAKSSRYLRIDYPQ